MTCGQCSKCSSSDIGTCKIDTSQNGKYCLGSENNKCEDGECVNCYCDYLTQVTGEKYIVDPTYQGDDTSVADSSSDATSALATTGLFLASAPVTQKKDDSINLDETVGKSFTYSFPMIDNQKYYMDIKKLGLIFSPYEFTDTSIDKISFVLKPGDKQVVIVKATCKKEGNFELRIRGVGTGYYITLGIKNNEKPLAFTDKVLKVNCKPDTTVNPPVVNPPVVSPPVVNPPIKPVSPPLVYPDNNPITPTKTVPFPNINSPITPEEFVPPVVTDPIKPPVSPEDNPIITPPVKPPVDNPPPASIPAPAPKPKPPVVTPPCVRADPKPEKPAPKIYNGYAKVLPPAGEQSTTKLCDYCGKPVLYSEMYLEANAFNKYLNSIHNPEDIRNKIASIPKKLIIHIVHNPAFFTWTEGAFGGTKGVPPSKLLGGFKDNLNKFSNFNAQEKDSLIAIMNRIFSGINDLPMGSTITIVTGPCAPYVSIQLPGMQPINRMMGAGEIGIVDKFFTTAMDSVDPSASGLKNPNTGQPESGFDRMIRSENGYKSNFDNLISK